MSRMRSVRLYRPLSLFAAILVTVVVWLVTVTDTRAGAVPRAPVAAAPAATTSPTTSATTSPTPTGTVPSAPNPSPYPPSAPGDLHVTAVTSNSVTLAWTASTPGCCAVDTYTLNYLQAFNDLVSAQDVGNVTTIKFTAVRPATEYRFWVSARDSVGHQSQSSNSVVVMTPITDTGPDTTPPSAPTGLTVTGVTAQGAALSWSPATDNVAVTGYNVYRFDRLYISTLLATVTGTSYTAPLGSPIDAYYVRARDAVGNLSLASNLVDSPRTTTSPTPPTPPLSCQVGYQNTAQWTGGFVAELTLRNTGQTPINGWALNFRFGGDQQISSAWNANLAQTGTDVTLSNADWNRVLAAGSSVSLGILGRWTADNTAPRTFAVNGVACTVG